MIYWVKHAAYLSVSVADVLGRFEHESEPEVGDARRHVAADQHVATLEVTVRDRRFVDIELRRGQVGVKERQALDHGACDLQKLRPRHQVALVIRRIVITCTHLEADKQQPL